MAITVVDRDSASWRTEVKGMLPLISTDTSGEMVRLVEAGRRAGLFAHSDSGQLVSTDMAVEQDPIRFIALGHELEEIRKELA